ncbi:MAG: hypothetical protein L3J67_00875 [Hyphomicrobiaceae bacterium]|nr:hypothetical protein [Hyphomicrobiaceae bacterium]
MSLQNEYKRFTWLKQQVSRFVLIMTVGFILYTLSNAAAMENIWPCDLIGSVQQIKGAFQYLAAVLLIMGAGFIVMFQKFNWLPVLFTVSILYIFLAASNGFVPE